MSVIYYSKAIKALHVTFWQKAGNHCRGLKYALVRIIDHYVNNNLLITYNHYRYRMIHVADVVVVLVC